MIKAKKLDLKFSFDFQTIARFPNSIICVYKSNCLTRKSNLAPFQTSPKTHLSPKTLSTKKPLWTFESFSCSKVKKAISLWSEEGTLIKPLRYLNFLENYLNTMKARYLKTTTWSSRETITTILRCADPQCFQVCFPLNGQVFTKYRVFQIHSIGKKGMDAYIKFNE